MARTYISANLRCCSANCRSNSVHRVICYACEKCYHTRCVGLEDKAIKIFLCDICKGTMEEFEGNACRKDRRGDINASSREEKRAMSTESCMDPSCHRSHQKTLHVKGIDRKKKKSPASNEEEDSDAYEDVCVEDSQAGSYCDSLYCTMKGNYRLVCLSCEKSYHDLCVDVPDFGHRTFWCDDCSPPPASYLDITEIASKIDGLFELKDIVQDSTLQGQASTSQGHNTTQGAGNLLNYDPFINDPDLVNYDPALAANSYHPSLGPPPRTEEEIRAWRERVLEAEHEIQVMEKRMQKARVIDRGLFGAFQERISNNMLNTYYTTPCDGQYCSFRGRYRVMCIKCFRMFHTGCLSLPDYDYETAVCFYCPLSDVESDIDNDDDERTDDFFLELHL